MKKDKLLIKQNPIQLSSNKKGSSLNLKHEQSLFTPYKIEWKNSHQTYGNSSLSKQPFRNLQNNNGNGYMNGCSSFMQTSGNKNFYQNMKNQLLNIKQDVQKMILKQRKQKSISLLDQQYGNNHYPSNSCIKTINIKNKCQKKLKYPKQAQIFSNIHMSIDKKHKVKNKDDSEQYAQIQDNFRQDQNLFQNLTIEQNKQNCEKNEKEQKNQKTQIQQKQLYPRIKSKSIADVLSRVINYQDKQKIIPNKGNITDRNEQLKNQFKNQMYESKNRNLKYQVNIDLSSFNTNVKQEQYNSNINVEQSTLTNNNNQNLKVIKNLKQQIHKLQTILNKKQEQLKIKFTFIQQLNKQLSIYKSQTNNKTQTIQTITNQINSLRKQINKLQHLLQQKCIDLNKLTNIIENQKKDIQRLLKQNYQLSNTFKIEQNNIIDKQQYECLEVEYNKLKEKLKLKENQLYIYQEQLKQAKQKIKQFRNLHQQIEKKELNINKQIKQVVKIQYKQIIDPKLEEQIQSLRKQINRTNKINCQFQIKINNLNQQNNELKQKILKLQTQNNKSFENLINNQKFSNIGQEISNKLSQMVNQNYSLKNKLNHLQARIDEINFHNRSLKEQIRIHQQRSKLSQCTRILKIEDWDNLTEQRDLLKNQLDKIKQRLQETKQFYQLQLMKKDNQISQLKIQITQLIDLDDEQDNEVHPNIRSIKHITNIQTLINEFKDMIDYNLEMKEKIKSLQNTKQSKLRNYNKQCIYQ